MTENERSCDLLLAGGRVIDPSQQLDQRLDVAIAGDRIVRVAPAIDRALAQRVVDVTGKIVTPGLIDLHVHAYQHLTDFGLPADDVGVHAGATTIVDQGSCGGWTFDGFKAFIADRAVTETLCFISINLSGTLRGCRGGPVIQNPDYADVDMLARFAARFPEVIKGVKTHGESGGWSHWESRLLHRAREAADVTGLPLYVHTGQLWPVDEQRRPEPESMLGKVIPFVRPGDILAHCYSAKEDGILGRREKPSAELLDAVASGVHLDIGHGVNFSYSVARRMMDAGLYPHTISTDVHGDFYTHNNDTTLDYSLMGAMSKLMALGFDLGFVIAATTVHPAGILRMADEIGTLKTGTRADVTVLDLIEEPWNFSDCEGEVLRADKRLLPALVVRNGKPVVPNRRLLRDVWHGEPVAA